MNSWLSDSITYLHGKRKKKKVLFSSSVSCCVFSTSFSFVQGCRLPVWCHSAPRCDSVQQVYTACTAVQSHYGKTLRSEIKPRCCKLHRKLEVKFKPFLTHVLSVIIQTPSSPVLCKSTTCELCLLCHLANPISFIGVVDCHWEHNLKTMSLYRWLCKTNADTSSW